MQALLGLSGSSWPPDLVPSFSETQLTPQVTRVFSCTNEDLTPVYGAGQSPQERHQLTSQGHGSPLEIRKPNLCTETLLAAFKSPTRPCELWSPDCPTEVPKCQSPWRVPAVPAADCLLIPLRPVLAPLQVPPLEICQQSWWPRGKRAHPGPRKQAGWMRPGALGGLPGRLCL